MVKSSKPHVALLASPGLGHLIPMVELAKRLVAQHGFTVTVIAVTTGAQQAVDEVLQDATLSCFGLFNTMVLPSLVDVSSKLGPNTNIVTRILAMVRSVISTLQSSINEMVVKPTAMVVDIFGTEAMEVVTKEFDMLRYVFNASNAWYLAYNLYLPYVQEKVDPNKPFFIPGCESIPGEDLVGITIHPESEAYGDLVRIGCDLTKVNGILVNTWENLEPKTLGAFKDDMSMKSIVKVPVYPIGPITRIPKLISKNELVEWLDVQPDESVVFVSFGSGGTLSKQQTTELAWGLEMSKQKFIWVIRPPIENDRAASLFKSTLDMDELVSESLPIGFSSRTRDHGIIVSKWVSQEEILQHRSIGGFVSHCGWNSTLESIVNGVPIIAWPLYAEQNMNAFMLVENLGIAIRPKGNPGKKLVSREEVAKMVKTIMVDDKGIELRRRVKELKASAKKALEGTGSSYCALAKVAKDCEQRLYSNVAT